MKLGYLCTKDDGTVIFLPYYPYAPTYYTEIVQIVYTEIISQSKRGAK